MLYQYLTMDDNGSLDKKPPSRENLHREPVSSLSESSLHAGAPNDGAAHGAMAFYDIMTSSSHVPRLLPFPYRLHHMLSDVEKREKDHIVSWMPKGCTFKVHKPTEFVGDVAPYYFNLTQYKSFKRQLLNYGFKRVENGPSNEGSEFYHPFFVRGDLERCRRVVREKKTKGNNKKEIQGPSMNRQQTLTCSFDSVLNSSRPIEAGLQKPRPNSYAAAILDPPKFPLRNLENASLPNSPELIDSILFGGAGQPTISWLFSGAVSLPELSSVLKSYSGGGDERHGSRDDQSDNNNCFMYQEDIISLFGVHDEERSIIW